MKLEGKRVLVTGAARRLGREMAVHLSRAGCDVTVHFNHSHAEAEALRKEIGCSLLRADFRAVKWDVLQKLMSDIGPIDILINNASTFQKSSWDKVNEQLWEEELGVNLKVPFFLSKFFGKQMKERGGG